MSTLEPLTLHFLGTGGGRFVMTSQRRRTAGIRLINGNTHAHIDPGPGALIFSNWAKLNPQKLDALIVTHCHPDHYNDTEVLIEAMTGGTKNKRGILAATESVLYGANSIGPSVSSYHQKLVESVVKLEKNSKFKIRDLKFTATEANHSDPASVGLKIENERLGTIAYTSDTAYFPDLSDQYKDTRLLILCVMWPRNNPLKKHLCTDDVEIILKEAKPKCAVLTHFGMRMLNAGPDEEASYLEEVTGIPVVPATDGMIVEIEDKIQFKGPQKRDDTRIVDA